MRYTLGVLMSGPPLYFMPDAALGQSLLKQEGEADAGVEKASGVSAAVTRAIARPSERAVTGITS
jgi:hypothetical protein